jgi:hypothetical protein
MKGVIAGSICLALAALAGCTTEPAHMVDEGNPYLSQGRIQFESSNIKYMLQIARVDSRRVGSGLLKIYVDFRNTTRDDVVVDVRTTFLDERGHVLEQTNWEPIVLNKRTVTEYTCTSLGNQAADYQIIIRDPRKH